MARPHNPAGSTQAPPAGTDAVISGSQLAALAESGIELQRIVARISPEEFSWQESHYDRHSRHGRELLFLMANHEWVRATSEIIELSRSDAIETTLKIDIDLDQVTHEAFRQRSGRFWLPLTVLPPQAAADPQQPDRHRLEPDPFATVTDAAGNLMPMLPTVDVRHQMSAAMAEIIVNMAVARWPGPDTARPTATRDQRLLLSAAIYRLLRRGPARSRAVGPVPPSGPGILADGQPESRASASRMDRAREELFRLLVSYNNLLIAPAGKQPRQGHGAGAARGAGATGTTGTTRAEPRFAPELARRAVRVLTALAESQVIVVPLNRDAAPTVLTVRVPTRSLHSASGWRLTRPSTWISHPLGRLEIDVLLPTADADRHVQIQLPDGVSIEAGRASDPAGVARPRLDILVRRPQPFRELTLLLRQILDARHPRPAALRQCLADLARSKAATARDTLRHYEASSARDQPPPADQRQALTASARDGLDRLSTELAGLGGGHAMAGLRAARDDFERETRSLFRRTSADRVSPRTVVARADMIEESSQRAIPKAARICANVAVTDGEYFSVARFSGRMSLLLMAIVLAFLVVWRLLKHSAVPSPEVLAIVLTLFSAIQIGQMERPDRSTLRGLLSSAGNWLIAASVFPAVVLAVVLAFPWGGGVPAFWAGGCVAGQLVFQVAMRRSPAAANGARRPAPRRVFRTDPPDYRHFEALHSNYWRSTTADALMIGRTAYAYVVWQQAASPPLAPLLSWRQADPAQAPQAHQAAQDQARDQSANILALLRAGTSGQAATFVVFRGEPGDDWAGQADAVARLFLDPNRLTPLESITSVVDVFVGVSRDELLAVSAHPLARILRAAAHQLIVLDAQLPVPVPVAGYPGRQWARVRVALRDAEDIRRLAPFLNAVHQRALAAPQAHRCVVAVRTAPAVVPRVISGHGPAPGRPATDGPPVLSGDLDVTGPAADRPTNPAAPAWRILAICADARSNIESDIVQGLAETQPQLRLSGLTYGLLYGTAVVFVLAHEPAGNLRAGGGLEALLQHRLGHSKLRVLVDQPGRARAGRELPAAADPFPLARPARGDAGRGRRARGGAERGAARGRAGGLERLVRPDPGSRRPLCAGPADHPGAR